MLKLKIIKQSHNVLIYDLRKNGSYYENDNTKEDNLRWKHFHDQKTFPDQNTDEAGTSSSLRGCTDLVGLNIL